MLLFWQNWFHYLCRWTYKVKQIFLIRRDRIELNWLTLVSINRKGKNEMNFLCVNVAIQTSAMVKCRHSLLCTTEELLVTSRLQWFTHSQYHPYARSDFGDISNLFGRLFAPWLARQVFVVKSYVVRVELRRVRNLRSKGRSRRDDFHSIP